MKAKVALALPQVIMPRDKGERRGRSTKRLEEVGNSVLVAGLLSLLETAVGGSKQDRLQPTSNQKCESNGHKLGILGTLIQLSSHLSTSISLGGHKSLSSPRQIAPIYNQHLIHLRIWMRHHSRSRLGGLGGPNLLVRLPLLSASSEHTSLGLITSGSTMRGLRTKRLDVCAKTYRASPTAGRHNWAK